MDEQQEIEEFVEQAKELMAQSDITQQQFFRIKGTHQLAQSEEEYNWLVKHGYPLEIVSYSQAMESLRQAQAQDRKRVRAKQAKKRAKTARKRNRG